MNLLVLGPQGSGKGTQGARIEADYGIPHVSTGAMFRDAIAARSELGLRVEPILAAGELVPDDVTVALIRQRLSAPDAASGFILDGFPRNLAQADALDRCSGATSAASFDAVLFFDLPDDVAIERMKSRDGRGDDTPEVIARRLEIYHDQTAPVVDHYRVEGKLVPLRAERSIEEVYDEIKRALA